MHTQQEPYQGELLRLLNTEMSRVPLVKPSWGICAQ